MPSVAELKRMVSECESMDGEQNQRSVQHPKSNTWVFLSPWLQYLTLKDLCSTHVDLYMVLKSKEKPFFLYSENKLVLQTLAYRLTKFLKLW